MKGIFCNLRPSIIIQMSKIIPMYQKHRYDKVSILPICYEDDDIFESTLNYLHNIASFSQISIK